MTAACFGFVEGRGSPAGDFSCAGVSPALSIAPGHLHLLTEVDNAADVFMLVVWMQSFNVNIVREPLIVHQLDGTTPSLNMELGHLSYNKFLISFNL